MLRHQALVVFPLLCGVTFLTIFCLVWFDIPSTETHPVVNDAPPKRQAEETYAIPLRSIKALTLTLSQKINISATAPLSPPLHHSIGIVRSYKQGSSLDSSETNTDPTNITLLSQNPNIDARGEWQRQQVEKYCRKYGLEEVRYQFPPTTEYVVRQNLFRHLLFDDTRHLIFCFIPKVGCTNMRRFFFVLQGIIPQETITWDVVSEEKYLGPGVQKASFLNTSLTDRERIHKIKTYYKFIIVRNPLERLLSAFLNKIAPPLDFERLDTFEMHKRSILEKYRPQDLERWSKDNGSFELQVSFNDYVRWIIDSDNALLNEHFAPIIEDAHPCRIRYHFYGNFKMYSSDVAHIMQKLNVSAEYFWDKSVHGPGHETKDYLQHYYSQLTTELREHLFEDLYQELDFYYHLYPEEKASHVKLLDIARLVT